MKKTLIAFGAALTCLGAAHAQSNVQLTGLVDMYVGSMKMAGQDRKSVAESGGMSTSWWGVQGTEDLGNGLKAGFNLGAFFQADDGSNGRFAGDTYFARDANVSLAGGFGKLTLGRTSAPNFLPSVFANPFGDSFEVSPLILHETVAFYKNGNYSTTSSDTGWSNQMLYSSPDFGGLSFNVAYQFGEVATANSKKNVGVNATYRNGGLMLTGFFERSQVKNPTGGLLFVDGTAKQDWMLGGSYDFGVVKLYGTYGQAKVKDDSYDAKTASLGLDIPVSKAGTIKAAVAHTKMDTNAGTLAAWDGKHTTTTIGYDHYLSKRTDVYGVVMNDRFTGLKSGTSLAVGIRHRF